ncbi:MAG: bifunctional hydroxymethylpyrimidine kinase/phosphomethylpyrimidine kinase [Pseudonocardiales bacterium]|nr:bifunctional hydroxymethylpyrimidine kinase/phosphomethylpyrimidine kinase [Pseudonocardiales bacterium]
MTRPRGHPRVVLSIAGSDPSGGAGIQADLKTFAALGAYGCAVVTSLTAQSTLGVSGVFPIPAGFVREQLDALFADVAIDAVKIGMLANAAIAHEVAAVLDAYRPPIVILDPVMVATSGDRLLTEDAEDVLREELLPRADVITPNLPEAAALLGVEPARTAEHCREQARALLGAGARRVLLKGGHLDGDSATDLLAFPDGVIVALSAPRVDTRNTHGTGCTLSSALAVRAAESAVGTDGRPDWLDAARSAKAYLTRALQGADALRIGGGHGPVSHSAGQPGWG